MIHKNMKKKTSYTLQLRRLLKVALDTSWQRLFQSQSQRNLSNVLRLSQLPVQNCSESLEIFLNILHIWENIFTVVSFIVNMNNVLQRRCFPGTISNLSQDLLKRTTARSYFNKTIKENNILTMFLSQVNYVFILPTGLLMETLGTHGRRATRISNITTITLIKIVPSLHKK